MLTTDRLVLKPLTLDHVNDKYLSWMNDGELLKWRGHKAFPFTMDELKTFVQRKDCLSLAILYKDSKTEEHIGNITLDNINYVHGHAEINFIIGNKAYHNKGLVSEAINALATHAFLNMGLHRVYIESPNPAACRAAIKSGFKWEGNKNEAFLMDGEHINIQCYRRLKHEVWPIV